MRIIDELGQPDDFAGRPYAYATNQIAHAAGGAVVALHLMVFAPVVVVVAVVLLAGLAIEVMHLRNGGALADSAEDIFFEVGGLTVALLGGALWPMWIMAAVLAIGVTIRSMGNGR